MENKQVANAIPLVWEVLRIIILTMLWQHRVDSVFHNATTSVQESEALIWRRTQLQLRALIKRLQTPSCVAPN